MMNKPLPALTGLLMLAAAGCSTTTRGPNEVAAAEAPAPATPVMVVDPWARSASPAGSAAAPAPSASPVAPTPAIAEPPAPAEAPAAAAGQRTHVVVKGETLYQLSVKYYGTGTKWPQIVDANPGLKPERMPVGKSIVIP